MHVAIYASSIMDIHSLIIGDTNMIEIYFARVEQNKCSISINLTIGNDSISRIQKMYGNPKTSKQKCFHHNELSYIYDLNDDSQYAYTKEVKRYVKHSNAHIYAIKHSKVPTHLFPCTNSIDYLNEYDISEYKITNRVSLIVRTDQHGSYVHLQYKHSENVDIDKVKSCMDSIISNVSALI